MCPFSIPSLNWMEKVTNYMTSFWVVLLSCKHYTSKYRKLATEISHENNGYGISASVRRTKHHHKQLEQRVQKAAHQARHQWRRWHIARALQQTRSVHALRLDAHPEHFHHTHLHGHPWRTLLDSPSRFNFFLFLLFVTAFLFHLELFLELLNTKCMANNLRCSAAEEWGYAERFTSPTGYEPELFAFDELYDSSVPFSLMIPSSDQDMEDLALEMITEAYRGKVDYFAQEGVSVSRRL